MVILNAEQMRAADAHAIQQLKIPSLTLMENAAARAFEVLLLRYPEARSIAIVCGKGNNGGDGLALARRLKQAGRSAVVLLLGRGADLKQDPAVNWKKAMEAGVVCNEIESPQEIARHLDAADLLVDAIFGTGLDRPAEGLQAGAIEAINHSGKRVLAIDVPSGVSSDTGDLMGAAVRADATVALAALKHCHVFSPACLQCGDIYVANIGIPASGTIQLLRHSGIVASLPQRPADSHKGTYGHALVIAGSSGKSGAAYLSAKAALRCGAGLVTVAAPAHAQSIIASYGPEIMTEAVSGNPDFFTDDAWLDLLELMEEKSAIALGPGIGTEKETLSLFKKIVTETEAPLVIDADGLNLLAMDPSILSGRSGRTTILTPHPGEMARLLGSDNATVQKDRIGAATRLARQTGAIVALKGFRTILASPSGNVRINPTGGQSLASAGTGDVLTGLITGFLCQKMQPEAALAAAVYSHGFAGNLFERTYPQQALNSADIIRDWNHTIHQIRTNRELESEYLKFHFLD